MAKDKLDFKKFEEKGEAKQKVRVERLLSKDEEILNQITNIIIEKLGADRSKITPDAKFIEDLGADSLDTVELIMQFEEDFDIEIPDEDAEKILSVNLAYEYIRIRTSLE